jgi:hypothetical protein
MSSALTSDIEFFELGMGEEVQIPIAWNCDGPMAAIALIEKMKVDAL